MKRNPFNNYATQMAELGLKRNPMSQEVVLVLMDQSRDHYQDAIVVENNRVKKWAKITKDAKLPYVQFQDTDQLIEDTDQPWIISMTVLDVLEADGTQRIPRCDDQILVDGILYTVSQVEPVNRFVDGLINCTVYPERSNQVDPLEIYSVTQFKDNVWSIVWGGKPTEMSTDQGTTWVDFASYIDVLPFELQIKDAEGNIAKYSV